MTSTHRSRPTAAGSHFSPAASAAASISSRHWAAKNGCLRRAASRRAFHPTDNGSPTALPNMPAAVSMSRQPRGGPARPVAPDFYRAQAHVWSPDGRHLLFWGQRHRDAPPENNVDWYCRGDSRRITGADRARTALIRERISGISGAAVSRCLGGHG